ncbi:MAG: oligosaccharide flippase family protein, partial [Clostridia bacterium]|nr:oligosaccharide flippase family protein [Clostridia bacterium]
MANKIKADMCQGPLWGSIFKFAFPIMLTGLIQSLYNAADTIIVGRFAGQEALAGVGTSAALTAMMLNLFLGLTSGVTVLLGNAIGANDTKNIHKIVHTSISLCIIGGLFIS